MPRVLRAALPRRRLPAASRQPRRATSPACSLVCARRPLRLRALDGPRARRSTVSDQRAGAARAPARGRLLRIACAPTLVTALGSAAARRRRTARAAAAMLRRQKAKPRRRLRRSAVLRDELRGAALPLEPTAPPGRAPRRSARRRQRALGRRRLRAVRRARRDRTQRRSPRAQLAAADTLPAPDARPVPGRPDPDPQRRRRPAHADLGRARTGRRDPRLPPARRPVRRPLGARQRAERLRVERRCRRCSPARRSSPAARRRRARARCDPSRRRRCGLTGLAPGARLQRPAGAHARARCSSRIADLRATSSPLTIEASASSKRCSRALAAASAGCARGWAQPDRRRRRASTATPSSRDDAVSGRCEPKAPTCGSAARRRPRRRCGSAAHHALVGTPRRRRTSVCRRRLSATAAIVGADATASHDLAILVAAVRDRAPWRPLPPPSAPASGA